jgi:hypothetical protein
MVSLRAARADTDSLAYGPIGGWTAPPNVSRDEMKTSFRWLLDMLTSYPVPIMIDLLPL